MGDVLEFKPKPATVDTEWTIGGWLGELAFEVGFTPVEAMLAHHTHIHTDPAAHAAAMWMRRNRDD